MLRTQRPAVIGMEEMYNIEAAIPHMRYIRDLLRFVTDHERARFNDTGWAYGDPCELGGDVLEVYTCQLRSILHTLFGCWSAQTGSDGRLGAEIHALSMIDPDEADELAGQLVRTDGGSAVLAESIENVKDTPGHRHLLTLADRFSAEDTRAGAFPRSSPGLGSAHVGLANLNRLSYRLAPTSLDEYEEAILVEITGFEEHIGRLERLILRGAGEGENPLLYRWRSDSTAASRDDGVQSLIMVLAEDLLNLNFAITDVVFARLLAAYTQAQH